MRDLAKKVTKVLQTAIFIYTHSVSTGNGRQVLTAVRVH